MTPLRIFKAFTWNPLLQALCNWFPHFLQANVGHGFTCLVIVHGAFSKLILCCIRGIPHWWLKFPHYLLNSTIFGKNISENKMCVFSPHILVETFLILRRIERNTVINVHTCLCKVPVFLSDFSDLNFLDIFSKKILKYRIS